MSKYSLLSKSSHPNTIPTDSLPEPAPQKRPIRHAALCIDLRLNCCCRHQRYYSTMSMANPRSRSHSRSSSPQMDMFSLDSSDHDDADSRPPGPSQIAIDFGGLLPAPGLLVKEDATEGCGGRVWPVGILLGRHLLRYHRNDLGDAQM